jgi:cellulose synthase/poly-beta-1,6-N-acetylglucosamine synthase-like glycosyltransferase
MFMSALPDPTMLANAQTSWFASGFNLHWLTEPYVRWPLTLAYVGVVLVIAIYGLHRYWLVYLFYKHRNDKPQPARPFESLPRVTIQLPMFNEANVSKRVIDATCAMDYPRELLQIQVLDDSTDDSRTIARETVEHWQNMGLDIQYIHRTNRQGFKAGALAAAMPQVTGQFIAIFDADFIPPADFLKQTVHYFTDPAIGMVQTRWEHLNREDSLLTRSQAILLDGHFVIEHTSRNRAGCWINFNGTAGIWRKQAITDAGGWQADTLTEDVDLSYRAQLKGWQFIYAPWIGCPAELPPEINAFKSQQHRWTKGTIQTAFKLLPRILKADAPLKVRKEAYFHLTCPVVYISVVLMVLLFYPAFFVNMQPFQDGTVGGAMWGIMLFAMGTLSAGMFYVASQKAQQRDVLGTILQLPLLMAIGVGISLNNARAAIEAIIGHESPFVRTPKYSKGNNRSGATEDITTLKQARPSFLSRHMKFRAQKLMPLFELLMAFYMVECIRMALIFDNTQLSLPFLVIFAAGYFYVGISSLWQMLSVWWASRREAEAAPQEAVVTTPAA